MSHSVDKNQGFLCVITFLVQICRVSYEFCFCWFPNLLKDIVGFGSNNESSKEGNLSFYITIAQIPKQVWCGVVFFLSWIIIPP